MQKKLHIYLCPNTTEEITESVTELVSALQFLRSSDSTTA